ncbi:DUF4179 domain-containing protein [Lysinibacillus agricola]|uniref:DUF4179 domain-containing protein n=1 Tax=Lysinibacillus agricola TaxID=2590012 RepID=A0ABX7AQP4_9BACI|nr:MULTISPECIES: DUF4179 domain-containing protein [Lysinibacillus]KOS63154.1 hypothetical protein AN161_07970 [Lysinibacillus sp. FJAT-14222]QQP12283.1 DUF4179 domain-containing protein [Lysinibacillus agricola]
MENDIKEVINNIDVPLEKLDQAIEKGMHSEKKKSKKVWKTAIVSSVASVALILGSGFISPKMASVLADVPLIGFMYNIVEHDKGLQTALSDDNKVKLNKTVTSNGIAITVEEVVYDGARLNVIFSMPEYMDIAPGFLYVNGRELNTGESLRVLEDQDGFRGLWEFPINEELPDEFDVTLKFLQVGSTEGEWVFSTPIKKVKNDSHKLVAGQSGKVTGISFGVESVEASTTSTKINVEFAATMEKLFSEEAGVLNATIMDQNGTPLTVLDQSGSGDDKSTTYLYLIEPLNKDITEIKIAYYFFPLVHERKDLIVPLADTLPQRISQGEMGDIVITDVTNKGHEATLSFYVDSHFPYNENLIPFDVKSESGESLITDFVHAIGPNKYQVSYQTNAGKPIIHTLKMPDMEVESSAIVTIPVK